MNWWHNYIVKQDDIVFIIEEKSILNGPIGQLSLYNIDFENRKAEFGRLMIGKLRSQGKGCAVRAVKLLLSWAFRTFNFDFIYLNVLKGNLTAIHIYDKCGFSIVQEKDGQFYMELRQSNK